jgi:transposase InsO family protein
MTGEKVPKLQDDTSYADWKKRVQIWLMGTEVKKNHQAPKLVMYMSGKPEEVAIQIEPEKLGAEDGVKVLLTELDKLFEEDKTQSVFAAIDNFNSYRRGQTTSMDEYIREFQQRYKALMQARGKKTALFEDGILAYLLLHQANLDSEQQRLIRATIVDLTYANMEKALKRTYGEGLIKSSSSNSGSSSAYSYKPEAVKIKTESSTFFENSYNGDEEHTYYEGESDDVVYDDALFSSDSEQPEESSPQMVYMHGQYYHRDRPNGSRFNGNSRGNFRGNRNNFNQGNRNFNQGFRQPRPYSKPQGYNNRPREYSSSQYKPNPYAGQSQFKRKCYICQAEDHWVKDCKYNGLKNQSAEKSTFFQSEFVLEEQVTFLIGETVNKALLDTGAPTTVCGKTWLRIFEESLSDKERAEIQTETCDRAFKFGDGDKVVATTKKKIPISLCGKDILLETHIVDNDVPLLLSRESMKKMGAIIDFRENTLQVLGGQGDIQITQSGHVVVPIGRCQEKLDKIDPTEIESCFYVNPEDPEKVANHLHRYFAHSSAAKISAFAKNANFPKVKEIIPILERLDKTCEFCLKHKSREKPHRKVAMPKGTVFNEVVAMDLKKLQNGVWILHFVDTVTRFSIACAVKNKSAEEILTKTFNHWISVLGRPGCYISDNGGEFVNSHFNEMCSLMNIKVMTSPAESPWCNGTVERHNGILGQMIEAVMDETGCNVDIAIAWSVNAKNSLNNVYGFSPYQLVLGRNPSTPNIMNYENLPALNSTTISNVVADHLSAMEVARKKFIELENSDRMRRVLRERVYDSANEKYLSGDVVYFKREKTGWQGPATVVGQLGNQVLLKHGGMLIRIHPCKIVLKTSADSSVNADGCATSDGEVERVKDPVINTQKTKAKKKKTKTKTSVTSGSSSDSDSDYEPVRQLEPVTQSASNLEENTSVSDVQQGLSGEAHVEPTEEVSQQAHVEPTEEVSQQADVQTTVNTEVSEIQQELPAEDDAFEDCVSDNQRNPEPSVNTEVSGIQHHSQLSAGKLRNGKLRHREVEKRDDTTSEVLFTEGDDEFAIYTLNKALQEDPKITEAKHEEIKKLQEFGVYDEVKDLGQSLISTRWVMTKKGEKYKGRLVARGFEEISNYRCDSPTVIKISLRMRTK